MNDTITVEVPENYYSIVEKTTSLGFTMSSDWQVGSLLRTLAASKPGGRLLELGTGTGLALSWMSDGMNSRTTIISVDNDPNLIAAAAPFFATDQRVSLICADGEQWINNYQGEGFDMIFADAWPGKYSVVEKTLAMLNTGGFYVVDDMMWRASWPEGLQEEAAALNKYLESRSDLCLTKMDWSSGIMIATKI